MIARSRELRKSVKELVHCGVYYTGSESHDDHGHDDSDKFGGPDETVRRRSRCSEEDSISSGVSEDKVECGKDMVRYGMDVATIKNAMKRFPNLRKVIVTNHWLAPCDAASFSSVRRLVRRAREHGGGNILGSPTARQHPVCLDLPKSGPLYLPRPEGQNDDAYDHGLISIIHAIAEARTVLTGLSVDYIDHPVHRHSRLTREGLSPRTFTVLANTLHLCRQAFRNLRSLALSLDLANHSQHEWDYLASGSVNVVLAQAACLEDLSLDFTNSLDQAPMRWFIDHKIPKLSALRLMHKGILGDELLDLILQHKSNLERLDLVGIRLCDCVWELVAGALHDLPKLSEVNLQDLGELKRDLPTRLILEDEVKAYILYGESAPFTDPNRRPSTPIRALPITAFFDGYL